MTTTKHRVEALDVANALIEIARQDNAPVSVMKLLKLLYFVQGWHMGIHGTPLFEEPFEAWDYGPVIPSVYRQFKGNGSMPILRPSPEGGPLPEKVYAFVRQVYDAYKDSNAIALANETHAPEGPWHRARLRSLEQRGHVPRDLPMEDQEIRDYFAQLWNHAS